MTTTPQRVDRLLGYLESDPDNLTLLADAAQAALEADRAALAETLLQRYAERAPAPPQLVNLAGLAALRQGRFDEAAARFEPMLAEQPDDAVLRFNLALARAGQADWAGVVALLDEAVADTVPAAATLRLQALHQLGDLEGALAWGAAMAARGGDDPALMGALSAAAMDAEDTELAAGYARRGGDNPEALATLGLLRLEAADPEDAAALFERALAGRADSGRALLGRGLAALADHRGEAAARDLDKATAVFQDHLGTWIAAGWAHFVAGDLERARQRLATALALDDTFAEAHGGLAVIDVLEGRLDDGRRGARTALRLDRECFSGLLARSLLLQADGDPDAAERLRRTAMEAPVGPSGQSISQMAAALASRRR